MIEIHMRHGEASTETGWGLTEEGQRQAATAAVYVQSHFSEAFSIGVHSGSRRAVETAQLLGLTGIEWAKDERLREVDWQGSPAPREFEPWSDMYMRVSAACEDWDANYANQNRIIVSHGGTMHMVRAYREQLIDTKFHLLFEEPFKCFTNCQMIIYTDQNPKEQAIDMDGMWVKSVYPWDLSRFGHDWIRLK